MLRKNTDEAIYQHCTYLDVLPTTFSRQMVQAAISDLATLILGHFRCSEQPTVGRATAPIINTMQLSIAIFAIAVAAFAAAIPCKCAAASLNPRTFSLLSCAAPSTDELYCQGSELFGCRRKATCGRHCISNNVSLWDSQVLPLVAKAQFDDAIHASPLLETNPDLSSRKPTSLVLAKFPDPTDVQSDPSSNGTYLVMGQSVYYSKNW